MAAYRLSESVRLAPYYADQLGAPIRPDEDGNIPEKGDFFLAENGQARVFNMPMSPGSIVYTDPGDLAQLSDEDKESAPRVLYSPFPQVYENLSEKTLSNLSGEYQAVEKLDLGNQRKSGRTKATSKKREESPQELKSE
jgi:hypothetical protein